MSEEWGPWIEHDGSPCPIPENWWIEVIDARGEREEGLAGSFCEIEDLCDCWDWSLEDYFNVRIICYRIRRPRGLAILKTVVESIREPEVVS